MSQPPPTSELHAGSLQRPALGLSTGARALAGSHGGGGAIAAGPNARSGHITLVGAVQIATVAALLLAVFWGPVRNVLIYKWSNDANWSHGWLIPLFSLYFLHMRRDEIAATPRKTCYWGLLVLVASLAVYFAFLLVWPRSYPRAAALVPSIFGVTLLMGGWALIRIVWFPIAFLLLGVPLPDGLYFEITWPLRQAASFIATAALPLIPGVETELGGRTVIDFYYQGRKGSLNVAEACSGMRLIMAFVTLGAVMAYLGDRPLWQRGMLVVFCIPIAIACNSLRVFITGVLYVTDLTDYARGTPHALLGIAMLPIAMGLYAVVGYVMSHLFIEEADLPAAEG